MPNLTVSRPRIAAGLLLIASAASAWHRPVDAGPNRAVAVARDEREQRRAGVVARVEKVALERVLNGAGWLRREFGPDWPRYVPADFQPDSFRVVRVFISVGGPVKGGLTTSFELAGNGSRMGGTAAFDPPDWRRRLVDVEVAPDARGLILWALVPTDSRPEDFLPARATIRATNEAGDKVEFLFSDLGP